MSNCNSNPAVRRTKEHPGYSFLAIGMSASSTCALRAAKAIRGAPTSLPDLSMAKPFVANRSFSSATQSRRPIQERICVTGLKNTRYTRLSPTTLHKAQPRSFRAFSNTPPRCALKTVQQIKARSKSGVSSTYFIPELQSNELPSSPSTSPPLSSSS